MRSVICVHEKFDAQWPWSADHWQKQWDCELYRTEEADARPTGMVPEPETVKRLVLLGFLADSDDLETFSGLEECFHSMFGYPGRPAEETAVTKAAIANGVNFVFPRGELYWGQSVAEYGLALTLNGLRRIPQHYAEMQQDQALWKYRPPVGKPNSRGGQYGDDSRFVNGTLGGKQVRVVGIGNIGARYAAWCANMGADVAVWDPFAPDAVFAVAGVTRCFHLSELVKDAEIFVPMVPLTDSTRGLVSAEIINAIPHGSLVIQVTRAAVCDTVALYKRVLNDELALAADVFDAEPVPLDSPLLGRHNVVHTPHNAGRTKDSNFAWADDQMARFRPR